MQKCLMALCLLITLPTFANTKAMEAAEAYALRDFDGPGIQNVEKSVKLYKEAIKAETVTVEKLKHQKALASAHYFLGTALEKKADKMKQHEEAMALAENSMTTLGVDPQKAPELSQAEINNILNKLDDENEELLAEAMYAKAISQAQWGNLKGIASSIGKLPQVLGLMERIEMMNFQHIHAFGPYRTIGRINFILPKLFGGKLEKSEEFLKKATLSSLAEGQKYSVNGYNNLYFAETLYKRGKENQAKKLLEIFVKADLTTLQEGSEPENKQAVSRAQELLAEWK